MKASLSLSWELTTEHAASSCGQAVLVNLTTGEAFGPGDPVQPYPGRGYMRATLAVCRLAQAAELDTAEQALIARFVGSLPLR